MSISFWTLAAIAVVLYFGWALVDPATVQEIEDHLARGSSAPRYGIWSMRARNGVGLVVGLLLLIYTLSQSPAHEPPAARRPVVARSPSSPPTALEQSRSLQDQIEGATLQKQIEHQEEMSRYGETEMPAGS